MAAGLLAVAALPMMPVKEVKAALEYPVTFTQEIKVADGTDHLHEQGVRVPQITFDYHFEPVVSDSMLPDNRRYVKDTASFPTVAGSGHNEFNFNGQTVDAATSDGRGIVSKDIVLMQDAAASAGAFNAVDSDTWAANKVYRYAVTIQNVAIGANTSGQDIRRMTNGVFTNGDNTIYIDVATDADKKVAQLVVRSSAATDVTISDDKVKGFTYSEQGTNLALLYNTYDLVLSSDYVGNASNYDHQAITYDVTISNLPDYFVGGDIEKVIASGDSQEYYYQEDAVEHNQNRQNFTVKSALAGGAITFTGKIQPGWHVVFPGLPAVNVTTAPYDGAIKYNTNVNFFGLTASTNTPFTADDYYESLYVGSNVLPVDTSISTLEDFLETSLVQDYENHENHKPTTLIKDSSAAADDEKNTVTFSDAKSLTPSASTDTNNVRLLYFDPTFLNFVLVGVVVRVIPGVILLGAAAAGGMLLLRRRRVDE